MIFGSVKEGILEILDERLGAFHAEVLDIVGARTFSGEKDPIASSRWLVDMDNTFAVSFFLEEAKVRFASCLLKDRA